MLQDDLKKANIQAIKDRNTVARSILSVVLNKVLLETKKDVNVTVVDDSKVLEILQKTEKELYEERDGYAKVNYLDKVADIEKQIAIVNAYLPKQMTDDDIKNVIAGLEDKSLPAVMRHFKTNFAGQCDMKAVSNIAKQG
ncbi:MAG: GatB/YqeY domain-containing protein [Clostridia bacterium]